jgi:multidrug efflux pump
MFVALTLTPVICSKILKEDLDHSFVARTALHAFEKLKTFYRKTLNIGLDNPNKVLALFGAIVALSGLLFLLVRQEFTPVEDRGAIMFNMRAPQGASIEYSDRQGSAASDILRQYVEKGEGESVLQMLQGPGGGNMILHLKPWGKRDRTSKEMVGEIGAKVRRIPGAQIIPVLPPTFGTNFAAGTQIVIGGNTYEELRQWRDLLFAALRENPRINGLRSDYNETTPQMRIHIDRNRAGDLGVSTSTIGQTLQVLLGSRKATTYLERGREYDVIMQAEADDRQTPGDVSNIYVRSDTTRQLVPLSSLVSIEEFADSDALSRYDRMRSITVSFNQAPGYPLGDVVRDVEQIIKDKLPSTARYTWRGEAGEMKESGALMYLSFALALIVVFLVLAAQFESFVHPFVIMMTVPLGVAGALTGLFISGQTINIYSQIGIIVLVGLAAKNGILIVEFTNQLRDAGMEFRQALVEAATIRLRPIIMTALATVMGSVPLVFATGAGAEGRRAIGVVIAMGVSFASFVTLLVVPVFYLLLARHSGSPGRIAAELREYEKTFPAGVPGAAGEGEAGHQPAE